MVNPVGECGFRIANLRLKMIFSQTNMRGTKSRELSNKKTLRFLQNFPLPPGKRDGMRGKWILVCLLFLMFALGCERSKSGITVAGSTSVEPFAELLAEEYMHFRPKSHIYVQGGGSSAGIQAVRSGAAHIGMSSRPLIGGERSLYAVLIARDAIAIIVHPKNTVMDLPLVKVREIFNGRIKNWKELGGTNSPITLVTREEGSGTREAFQKLLMGEEEISLDALVQDSNGAIRQVVAGDPNAIGYLSLGLVNERVKALRISGVEPCIESIESGQYHLVRPFLFLFKDEPSGEEKLFLDFVMSPKAQTLLVREGLVSGLTTSRGK